MIYDGKRRERQQQRRRSGRRRKKACEKRILGGCHRPSSGIGGEFGQFILGISGENFASVSHSGEMQMVYGFTSKLGIDSV